MFKKIHVKICIAQIETDKGNIEKNIETHKEWIELAISENVDFITFSELSLTGYEPELAERLATDQNDLRLAVFQKISELNCITIGVGLPIKSEFGILISMVIFKPKQIRQIYSKQKLHSDELPYFVEGNQQLILVTDNEKIAPAICYESLQVEHAQNAINLGAEIYMASVAKPQNGIEKAFSHYPKIAKKYSIPVLMSNCIGFCDNFLAVGQSAIWNREGELLEKLSSDKEGILIYDTKTDKVVKKEKITSNNKT